MMGCWGWKAMRARGMCSGEKRTVGCGSVNWKGGGMGDAKEGGGGGLWEGGGGMGSEPEEKEVMSSLLLRPSLPSLLSWRGAKHGSCSSW